MQRALVSVMLVGCGGTAIPQHDGYKSAKATPWKKARTLKFDDKGETKQEGDLSYPDMRRAAWFLADLATPGSLDLRVEITPPGDAVNDEFDLGFEVLDPGNRVVVRSDLEEGEGAKDLIKSRTLKDLVAGKYLIHLYLQGRLDTADYVLRASFKPSSLNDGKSDFPAQVKFVPSLPMVPLNDDTPKNYRPPNTTVVHASHKPITKPDPQPAAATMSARIIGMIVVAGGTQITIGRGTASSPPATAGMKGKVVGVPSGNFNVAACNERSCTAVLQGVTPDQVKSSGSVELTP
jgi:hypothetical protein